MFSPQDIEEKTFEKAFMGGYKAEDVDDFLDGLAADYKKLFIENAELKKKISILVEKIEEYRKDEEYIKSAILYSQKLKDDSTKTAGDKAEEILKEAKEKAEAILCEANIRAKDIHEDADRFAEVTKKTNADLIARENEALNVIRKEVSDFKQSLQNMYKSHLKVIMSLPNYEEPLKQEQVKLIDPIEIEKEVEKELEAVSVPVIEPPKVTQYRPNSRINIALDVKEEPDEDEELLPPPKFTSIDFKVTPKGE